MFNTINNQLLKVRKIVSIIVAFLIISGTLLGQGVPQAFNYQAVIRTPTGELTMNTSVKLKINILQGINANNVLPIYEEEHAVTTNQFGLVNINVGWGDIAFGDFSTIDWASADHFLGVEVSVNGGPYVYMGRTQLLSVPYAFVAQRAVEGDADDDPTNELNIDADLSGTTLNITDAGGTIPVDLSSLEESAEAAAAQVSADAAQATADQATTNAATAQASADAAQTTADQATTDAATAQTAIDAHIVADEDIDPLNEIQDISLVGHELTLSDGSTLTLPDNVDDADSDPVNEIQALSQDGTDVILSKGGGTITVADNDNDPSNELQDISLIGHELTLSDGSTLTLPDNVDDGDADPINELQDISIVGHDLTLSDGSTLTLPDDVDDADHDPENEIELPLNPQAGTIAFYNSGNWQVLTPGTDGQVLKLSGGLPVWADDLTETPLAIGDVHAGGIIFYLDGSGEHGLVAALSDQSLGAEWGCFGTDIPGLPNVTSFPPSGTGAEVGDGATNTDAILNECTTLGIAAAICAVYDDGTWFLPSIGELDLMYTNLYLNGLGNFQPTFYWSSTENGSGGAWGQSFANGFQIFINKDFSANYVRAVRAF
jgi:hypothetical protein